MVEDDVRAPRKSDEVEIRPVARIHDRYVFSSFISSGIDADIHPVRRKAAE